MPIIQFSDVRVSAICQWILRPKGMRTLCSFISEIATLKSRPRMIWWSIAGSGRSGFVVPAQKLNHERNDMPGIIGEASYVGGSFSNENIFELWNMMKAHGEACETVAGSTIYWDPFSVTSFFFWFKRIKPIRKCVMFEKTKSRRKKSDLHDIFKEGDQRDVRNQSNCSKRIGSKPECLRAVVKACDRHTKYWLSTVILNWLWRTCHLLTVC